MNKSSLKEIITDAVIKQLPTEWTDWSQEEAMKKWWVTFRREGGLRLSDIGDMAFRIAEIEFYNYDLLVEKDMPWQTFILDLNKKIKCPYYLGTTKQENKKAQPYIRLYDSKVAIMVSLYGNINLYLKSIKIRK